MLGPSLRMKKIESLTVKLTVTVPIWIQANENITEC